MATNAVFTILIQETEMKSLDTTLVAYARAHVFGGHIVSISAEIPQNAALYGGLIFRNFALPVFGRRIKKWISAPLFR
jgi:hypothetical protein